MAAIINDRDKKLQDGTIARLLTVSSNYIDLLTNSNLFSRTAQGGVQPSAITVTPLLIGRLTASGNLQNVQWSTSLDKSAIVNTNTFTVINHGYVNGQRIVVSNIGSGITSGLTNYATYYIVNASANTFQLATTSTGSAITITSALTNNTCSVTEIIYSIDSATKVVTLSASDIVFGRIIIFTATLIYLGNTYTKSIALNSVSDTPVLSLTKDSINIQVDTDGTGGSWTDATSTAEVIIGSTVDTNNWTFNWSANSKLLSLGTTQPVTKIGTASLNTINITAHGWTSGQRVVIITKGAGIVGINALEAYYVINPTTNNFQLSTVVGGSAAPITISGTDVDVELTVGSAIISSTNTKTISVSALNYSEEAVLTLTATKTGWPTLTKTFSVTKARRGDTSSASSYVLSATPMSVIRNKSGNYVSPSITFKITLQTGLTFPTAYAGRFDIQYSPDGINYLTDTTRYTSSVDQSEYEYTIPAGAKSVRCKAYTAGGFTQELKSEIVGIVDDGTDSVFYWLQPDDTAYTKTPIETTVGTTTTAAGKVSPSSITFRINQQTVDILAQSYSGRFDIQRSIDGTTYLTDATRYISANNEAFTTYSIPDNTKLIKARAFTGQGTYRLVVRVFKASKTAPEPPSKGTGSITFPAGTIIPPLGWSANPPVGGIGYTIYESNCFITGETGTIKAGVWSTPVSISGWPVTLYSSAANPTAPTTTVGVTASSQVLTVTSINSSQEFVYTNASLTSIPQVGWQVVVSGTLGGNATLTGYINNNIYYITSINTTTKTFKLSEIVGGPSVGVTAGTLSGLTFTASNRVIATVPSGWQTTPIYSGTTLWRITGAYIVTGTFITNWGTKQLYDVYNATQPIDEYVVQVVDEAVSYWVEVDSMAVIKNIDGTFTPPNIVATAYAQTKDISTLYKGRLRILTGTKNTTTGVIDWSATPAYSSTADETTKSFTIPTATVAGSFLKVQLYRAGGFTQLVSEETVSVIESAKNATAYWMDTDVPVVTKTKLGVINPSTVTARIWQQTAAANSALPQAYPGLFEIFIGVSNKTTTGAPTYSTNPVYTTITTGSTAAATYTYTVPTTSNVAPWAATPATIDLIKIIAYTAGTTSTNKATRIIKEQVVHVIDEALDGEAQWITSDTPIIIRRRTSTATNNLYLPSSVTFSMKSQKGPNPQTQYLGRMQIQYSTDSGTTYTTAVEGTTVGTTTGAGLTANSTTGNVVYRLPTAANVTQVKALMYASSTTTTQGILLDTEIINVNQEPADGVNGIAYWISNDSRSVRKSISTSGTVSYNPSTISWTMNKKDGTNAVATEAVWWNIETADETGTWTNRHTSTSASATSTAVTIPTTGIITQIRALAYTTSARTVLIDEAVATVILDGSQGANGTRTAILDLYKYSATKPTADFPSGSSTYTWASGTFTLPATPNSWSLTPPSPVKGQTLWIARVVYTDTTTDATSNITFPTTPNVLATGYAGGDGADGKGYRVAFLELYKWATSQPTTSFPSGSSTYTWASGTFTLPATPNSWTLNPTGGGQGQTLWAVSVTATEEVTGTSPSATSSITWPTSLTPYSVGYFGSDGKDSVINYISIDSSVIFKDAVDQTTSGTHTDITIQGKTSSAGTITNIGFYTITRSGDTEGAVVNSTAGASHTFKPANTANATSYVIKLYNNSSKTTLLDTQTVPIVFKGAKGVDGKTAITAVISNESHTLPADKDGNVSSYVGSGTRIQVFEGASELQFSTTTPGNSQYNVTTTPAQTTAGTNDITAGAITATTSQKYGTSAIASGFSASLNTTTIQFNISGKSSDGTAFTITKTQTLTKTKQGDKGDTGATGAQQVLLYAIASKNVNWATANYPGGSSITLNGWSNNGSFTIGAVTWYKTPQTPSNNDDAQWQIDGTIPTAATSTTNLTWQGPPYISYFKVGSLSAITANIGEFTSSTATGKTVINSNGMQIFSSSDGGTNYTLRVKIGKLV